MKKLLLFLLCSVAFGQTTNYPGALDTNSSLFVTADNLITTLTSPQQIADNVLIVASSSRFSANMIATVCDTVTSAGICTAWEHELVTAVNGNVLTVTRAFGGTSAGLHATGKPVAVLIDAAHQTALKAAVIAVETALGANMSNVPGSPNGGVVPVTKGGTGNSTGAAHGVVIAEGTSPQNVTSPGTSGQVLTSNGASADPTFQSISAFPAAAAQLQYLRTKPNSGNLTTYEFTNATVANTADYNFAAQTPGGSIVIGSNSVTFTPVPLGVNGTDTNHRIYISGGVGTAEACLITGGTGVAGSTSGTIILNCANTHSGAWTATSATAGCSEAFWSNGGAGNLHIQFPAGQFTTYAPCYISSSNTTVAGRGIGTTQITNATLNSEAFTFNGGASQLSLSGMLLMGNASSTTGACVEADSLGYVTIRDVYCIGWPTGFKLVNLVTSILANSYVRDIHGGDGVLVDGNSTNAMLIDGVLVISSYAYQSGLHIAAGGNTMVYNSQFIGNFGGVTKADIWIAPTAGNVFSTDIVNTYADQGIKGLWINPTTGNQVIRTRATHFWASSVTGTGIGIHLDSSGGGQIHGFSCNQCDVSGGANNGVQVDNGDTLKFTNSTFSNNAGTGIALNAGQWITITGNQLGNGFGGWGGGPTQQYGVFTNGTPTDLNISGNIFSGNAVATISLGAVTTGMVLGNNEGLDNVVPTIASAATITSGSVNSIYSITGTTTVTTINGALWTGRKVTLLCPSGVVFGGGGNIPIAHTCTAGTSVNLVYDGTNWR